MSRAEALRRRVDSQFVGRRAQLALFADNLRRDPDPEAGPDPADFLFHVRGVGGIGKSTLIAQWRETARRAGGRTALIDDTDVQGVDTAMAALATQLATENAPFKDFDRALEQYRRDRSAPSDLPSLPARVVAHAALGAANTLAPGAAAFTTPETVAEGTDRLFATVRRRRPTGDSELATLSRAFVTELARLCDRRPAPWVVLFLDTWEITGRHLDSWLRELINGGYGDVPLEVIIVLAGRDELAERDWADLRPAVVDVALDAFTEQEARELLAGRGVQAPDAVEAIVRMSLGLPLLLTLLASTDPHSAEEVADAGTDAVDKAVQRFLQWIPEPSLRATVLAAALPPRLDRDLFCLAVDDADAAGWDWLLDQPFVTAHGDAHHYHAVVRTSLLRHHRVRAPHAWRTAHARLAEHHAASAGPRRLLDETYHLLCADPSTRLPLALERLADAAGRTPDSLTAWADTLDLAARDTADPALLAWADRLRDAVTGPAPAEVLLSALAAPGLPARLRALAMTWQGQQFVFREQDADALALLDQALSLAPGLLPALVQRGRVHAFLGHHDLALTDLDAALARTPFATEAHEYPDRLAEAVAARATSVAPDPDHVDTFCLRGMAERMADRPDEALPYLDAALALAPDSVHALSERGMAHYAAGRFDRALTDFTAAHALAPGNATILSWRGQTYRLMDRLDQALIDLDAAHAIDPANRWTLYERGAVHRLADRLDQALTDLDAAHAIDPTNALILAERGEVHRVAGRLDQALADFTAALALDPTNVWIRHQRALAHHLAGRLPEAIEDFTTVLTLDPASVEALTCRGTAHSMANAPDSALADFDAALAIDPDAAWALLNRAVLHQQADRPDQARTDLDRSIAADPANPWARCARGELHRFTGRLDLAVEDFTAALAIQPAFPEALARRGQTHRQAGRPAQALADLDAALALEPDDTFARYERADLHLTADRFDEAVTDLTAALARDPSLTEVRCTLAAVLRRQRRWQAAREALAEAADPSHPGVPLEQAMLHLHGHGPDSWDAALAAAVRSSAPIDRAATAVLHAVATPSAELPTAAAEFLALPDPNRTIDTLRSYLRELTATRVADRAATALTLLG
ncbi:tetratricopeptide repeat protein [Kitasatospora sp. NPDC004531]